MTTRSTAATEITWWGHATWQVKTGAHTLIVDPFFDDNPASPIKSRDVTANYLLVSHGHYDHVADAASIALRTGATIVSNYDLCQWFVQKHRVPNVLGMNLGGGVDLPFGRVVLTLAFHSSQLPDGSYGGNPGGFLLTLADGRVYFACDTALFGDMQLLGRNGLDLAVLPIGDLFTMGPDDALEAVRLLRPKRVAPSHFGTWPPIAQDAGRWADRVRAETSAEPVVLRPGETIRL